jgi:tripartite-type tricarboxylate transporter receptor subunit TctC
MAPAGTPADRIAQIQQAIATLLKDPALKAQMESLGMTPVGSSAAELATTILNDRRDMEPLVKKLGIRLQ